MAKSLGIDEKQLRADAVAMKYKAAFIEQFNQCFATEIPARDVGPFTGDKNAGKSDFVKALREHKKLHSEDKKLLLEQARDYAPVPGTTVKAQRRNSPAWVAYRELPEADKAVFESNYIKSTVLAENTRQWLDELPSAIKSLIHGDMREAKITKRIITAASQELNGEIDETIYSSLVAKHVNELMRCGSVKTESLEFKFKQQLLTEALEQLPVMMKHRDPEVHGTLVVTSDGGVQLG